jgi:lactoylglutathione lyase
LQLRSVLVTTQDMSATLADFAALSANVSFRDGDHYAVIEGSVSLGIAIASPEDHPSAGELVLTAKAGRVGEAVEGLLAAGGDLRIPIHKGEHEFRALVQTAGGLLLMIYGPEE